MAAGHAKKNDIPSEIHEARRRYPGVAFHYGRHLHLHANVLRLCELRIEEAEHDGRSIDRGDTLLLVVGPGQQRPGRERLTCRSSHGLLGEGMGFGWERGLLHRRDHARCCREALERCQRMGFARIVVFPFFLFTGVLEKAHPPADRGVSRRSIPTLISFVPGTSTSIRCSSRRSPRRAEEAVHGSPNMNCELCKYRVQLPGFAASLGQPQAGHHHHVRGVGQGHPNS